MNDIDYKSLWGETMQRLSVVAGELLATRAELRDATRQLGEARAGLQSILAKRCGDGKSHCHHMGPLLRVIASAALEASSAPSSGTDAPQPVPASEATEDAKNPSTEPRCKTCDPARRGWRYVGPY